LKMWWNIWLICVLVFILYCLYYLIDIMYVHEYKYNTILNWLQERYAWCIHCFWRDVKKNFRNTLYISLYIILYYIILLYTYVQYYLILVSKQMGHGGHGTWENRLSGTHLSRPGTTWTRRSAFHLGSLLLIRSHGGFQTS
jgi:hypothetical protein